MGGDFRIPVATRHRLPYLAGEEGARSRAREPPWRDEDARRSFERGRWQRLGYDARRWQRRRYRGIAVHRGRSKLTPALDVHSVREALVTIRQRAMTRIASSCATEAIEHSAARLALVTVAPFGEQAFSGEALVCGEVRESGHAQY